MQQRIASLSHAIVRGNVKFVPSVLEAPRTSHVTDDCGANLPQLKISNAHQIDVPTK